MPYLLSLAETHQGLAGWVGAIGSVIAVFVAWAISRNEYKRIRLDEAVRRRDEIDLMTEVISDFENSLMSGYVGAIRSVEPGMFPASFQGFYSLHMNDPQWHSMRDLAHVPITQWPSLEAYARFKQYWFISIRILETSNDPTSLTHVDISTMLVEREMRLSELRTALQKAI